METEAILALAGIIGAQSTILGWVIRKSLNNNAKLQKQSIETQVSLETYLRDRNGRDAEQHKENIKYQKKTTKALGALAKKLTEISGAEGAKQAG